jgi:hypothetical protein
MKRRHELLSRGKTFEKVAQVIGAIAAIAAGFGLLYHDGVSRKPNPTLKEIGTLKRQGDDVKLKPFGEGSFMKTKETEKVFLKDTLYAGAGTKVDLDLGPYGKFEFIPNSVVLLLLDFEADDFTLKPGDGGVGAGDARLKIALTQGKMTFSKTTAGDPLGVSIELAKNTRLSLDDQNQLKLEKNTSGDFKITESDKEAKLEISTSYEGKTTKKTMDLRVGKVFKQSDIAHQVQEQRIPATVIATPVPEPAVVEEEAPPPKPIRMKRIIRLEEEGSADEDEPPTRTQVKQEVIETFIPPVRPKK